MQARRTSVAKTLGASQQEILLCQERRLQSFGYICCCEGLVMKETDGKAEQKIYDKFACFCGTISERKATDIHQGLQEPDFSCIDV